jgi:hypothetical protein
MTDAVVKVQVAPLREEVTALKAAAAEAAVAAAAEAEKNRVLHEGLLFAAAESGDK